MSCRVGPSRRQTTGSQGFLPRRRHKAAQVPGRRPAARRGAHLLGEDGAAWSWRDIGGKARPEDSGPPRHARPPPPRVFQKPGPDASQAEFLAGPVTVPRGLCAGPFLSGLQ